jgi:hypothetical protein
MPCRPVRQGTEIARLWIVRRGAIVSAGTVRRESDTACPSERGMGSSLCRSRTPRFETYLFSPGLDTEKETTKALGLTIPQSLLLRADQVIQ